MDHPSDDSSVAYPEIVTLHWEGPERWVQPEEIEVEPEADGPDPGCRQRSDRGQSLWSQIEREAPRRGDAALWRRKLDAYRFVKLEARGSAGAYARRFQLNHATVRSWISEVAKLAYQVGYRLHEDRLLLVGEAPAELRRLRELVNRDAAAPEAWRALQDVEGDYRGEDPYFHLNEGHVLRARGRLRESDASLKEGLAIAEAPCLRSLLWNARGQTYWDCDAASGFPLADHLERAERAFRRAAVLDRSTYFPFVNLSHLAIDVGDTRRAEYWIGELAAARKGMDESMRDDLARYLEQAEWSGAAEETRFWRAGPLRWIQEAARKGVLVLAAALLLLSGAPAAQAGGDLAPPDAVAHDGSTAKGGAGGN